VSAPSRLEVRKLVHVNQLVDDFEKANAFYVDVFGAEEYWRGYDEEQRRDASLFVVGELCIELFAPRDRTSLLGRSLDRYGNSWHSFEWQVPDLEAARQALQERGVRMPTYRAGRFLMTHPADCHGMLLELTPLEMPGDPRLEPGWTPGRWRDGHPLGITGFNRLSVAVRDLDAAAEWLTALVDAPVRYEESRPEVDADAIGFQLPGHVLELLQARSGRGPVADYVARYGPRLRSVELGVVDVDRAAAYLTSRGLGVVPGSRQGAIALVERDNWGVRWELAR